MRRTPPWLLLILRADATNVITRQTRIAAQTLAGDDWNRWSLRFGQPGRLIAELSERY
jgi:hypothetical protein